MPRRQTRSEFRQRGTIVELRLKMIFLAFCAFILGLQAVYAQNQSVMIEADYTSPATNAVIFTVRKPIVLHCNVTIEGSYTSADVEWKKGDTLVGQVEGLKGRFKPSHSGLRFTLTINNSEYHDAGNWSCGALVDGQVKSQAPIVVASNVQVRIKPENINVVEEEKLRIECSVLGNPHPMLTWAVDSANFNGSEFDGRVSIQDYKDDAGNNVENGVFIIDKVNKTDRGSYTCIATNRYHEHDHQEFRSTVRVKDKYAALWPFLGICIEVVVLCAIIIIYEKKRNKTELEESDTDQSPDQKNTPDHGKDANLRHRQ